MPHAPRGDQEQNGNSDAERAALIAGTSNLDLRRKLEQMVAARDAALAEVQVRQGTEFERDVAATLRARATAARNPAYRGLSWPTTREAAVQAVEVRYRGQLESVARPFNDQIDELLAPQREERQAGHQASYRPGEERGLLVTEPNHPNAELQISEAAQNQALLLRGRAIDEQDVPQGRTEEQVDWRRAMKEPEYRREIQGREFREVGLETCRHDESTREPRKTEPTPDTSREASTPGDRESTEVDWRRALKDPEYRQEIQGREFRRTANELTTGPDRQP